MVDQRQEHFVFAAPLAKLLELPPEGAAGIDKSVESDPPTTARTFLCFGLSFMLPPT